MTLLKLNITLVTVFILLLSIRLAAKKSNAISQIEKVNVLDDTIVFTLNEDFKGDCQGDCFKYIGYNLIDETRDTLALNTCNYLFVKCPSVFRLKKDVVYRFIAKPFTPDSCSTSMDTCIANKYYHLIKNVEIQTSR